MEGLYLPGSSAVHRLPAQVKIVAALLFVLVVVATPREWWGAFLGYVGVLVVVGGIARVPPRVVLRRLTIEVPFVIFAVLLPFVGQGERIEVGPLSLSEPGLWATWNILAKATLGVATAVILAATTPAADLVGGLARLRLPSLLVAITGFMVRYADVVADESRRVRTAMAARGLEVRNLRAWPMVAASLGALFIRTYERGERVHVAMLSRGYDGTAAAWSMGSTRAEAGAWVRGLAPPAAALAIAVTAWAT